MSYTKLITWHRLVPMSCTTWTFSEHLFSSSNHKFINVRFYCRCFNSSIPLWPS